MNSRGVLPIQAATVAFGRASRSRPAGGHFLLLAQKKVTKEEGLNAIWLAAMATTHAQRHFDSTGHGPRMRRAKRVPSVSRRIRGQCLAKLNPWPSGFSCHGSETNRIEALCFGSFHLGPQMKGTRRPGETGGLLQAALSSRWNA
jgi:hypothetical protein